MRREIKRPVSSLLQHLLPLHLEHTWLKCKDFAFAPEALPGNSSRLKPPGQDRVVPRMPSASVSEPAVELRQCREHVLELEDILKNTVNCLLRCTLCIHRRYSGKVRILSGLAEVQEVRDGWLIGCREGNFLEPCGTLLYLP